MIAAGGRPLMRFRKIHIILAQDVCEDMNRREQALEKILSIAPMRNVNTKRVQKYGILTGEVDETESTTECLKNIKQMAEVDAVEVDGEQFAI